MEKKKNKDLYSLKDIGLVCDIHEGFYSAIVWYHGQVIHTEHIDSRDAGLCALLRWLEAEPEHQDSAEQLAPF